MTIELDDLDLWPAPDVVVPTPRKCRRHTWAPHWPIGMTEPVTRCLYCPAVRDPAVSRRNKNNRKRGNAEELTTARLIGGRKVGPLGHPWDVEIEGYMRLQVKKLAKWPSLSLVASWMDAIPVGRDMRGVALIQPGRGGRRFLVLDLSEFGKWHGDPTEGERL